MVGLTFVLLTYYGLLNKTIIPSFVDFAHVVPEMAILTLGVEPWKPCKFLVSSETIKILVKCGNLQLCTGDHRSADPDF